MKAKCARCLERPAMSVTLPICEVCSYREVVGESAAERQTHAANVEREREKVARERARGRAASVDR